MHSFFQKRTDVNQILNMTQSTLNMLTKNKCGLNTYIYMVVDSRHREKTFKIEKKLS